MNEVIVKSVVISRIYSRYGGDADCTIGLMLTSDGVLLLYANTSDGYKAYAITSNDKYIEWLFHNSMDIMSMLGANAYPHYWFNDKQVQHERINEFRQILSKI